MKKTGKEKSAIRHVLGFSPKRRFQCASKKAHRDSPRGRTAVSFHGTVIAVKAEGPPEAERNLASLYAVIPLCNHEKNTRSRVRHLTRQEKIALYCEREDLRPAGFISQPQRAQPPTLLSCSFSGMRDSLDQESMETFPDDSDHLFENSSDDRGGARNFAVRGLRDSLDMRRISTSSWDFQELEKDLASLTQSFTGVEVGAM